MSDLVATCHKAAAKLYQQQVEIAELSLKLLEYKHKLEAAERELAQFKAATFRVTTQATLDHIVERLTL